MYTAYGKLNQVHLYNEYCSVLCGI